jgi:hypothetical protein
MTCELFKDNKSPLHQDRLPSFRYLRDAVHIGTRLAAEVPSRQVILRITRETTTASHLRSCG